MDVDNLLMCGIKPVSVSPDDILALRFVRDATLSPDGRLVASVISRTSGDQEHIELWLQDAAGGSLEKISEEGEAAILPRWSPNGNSLIFVANGGLKLLDVACKRVSSIRPAGWGAAGPPNWSRDGRSVAISKQKKRQGSAVRYINTRIYKMEGLGFIDDFEHAIVAIDLDSDNDRIIAQGGGPYVSPQFSPDGKHVLFAEKPKDSLSLTPHLYIAPAAGGEATCIAGDGWYIEAASWTPDSEQIVIIGDFKSRICVPVTKLWIMNIDGSGAQLRTPGLEGHIGLRAHHDMPIWGTPHCISYQGDNAIVSLQSKGRCGIWSISLRGTTRLRSLVGGDRTCILVDVGKRLLFITTDLMHPTEIAIANLDGRHERQVTDLNSATIINWPTMKTVHLPFSSPDSTKMEAWSMSRADHLGPQPTVLYIHGGPFLGQGHYFRFDTHLLAANGISVLFANFRGSAGYGEAFSSSIIGDWGTRGFPDHMATVDAAIAANLADPKRLGVWGHSHGGFATSWIIGHTNRFKAAVAEAPVTNFETIYYLSDQPDGFALDLGGSPVEIPDVYRSRSPISYAHRCKTPTRIIHGERDLRCTLAEAEQLYRALRDTGCESDLVILNDCDHLGDAQGPVPARVGQNEALLGWFLRWLK